MRLHEACTASQKNSKRCQRPAWDTHNFVVTRLFDQIATMPCGTVHCTALGIQLYVKCRLPEIKYQTPDGTRRLLFQAGYTHRAPSLPPDCLAASYRLLMEHAGQSQLKIRQRQTSLAMCLRRILRITMSLFHCKALAVFWSMNIMAMRRLQP